MKRIINFILQHFLVTAFVVVFSIVIFREITTPDYNLIEAMEKNNANWKIGVSLIFFGVLFMLSVGFLRVRKIPNKKITNGLIVETEYNFSAGNRYAYFRYYVNDVPYVMKSKYMEGLFHKGDYWRIAYNEKKPEQAELCPLIRDYFIVGGLIGFGFFNIILDLFVF